MEKLEASLSSRAKSKSPYSNIKPKINNRSVTIGKYENSSKKADRYLHKLSEIRDILKSGKKDKE